jgi:hypothetical protein
VSYAIATYALVIVGVVAYAAVLARSRRRLAEALRAGAGSNRG